MRHAERRAVFPGSIATPQARETTLASRSWRTRVAVGALLRELRVVCARGIAAETISAPSPLGRVRPLLSRAVAALLPRRARRRPVAELVITADWRIPGDVADPMIGRRRLDEPPQTRHRASRAGADARELDTLLAALGDVGPEELETALRVVRRVRALAGAA